MLPGWESTEATSPEGLCRGKLKPWAGAIVSVYLTPFFFCGFQNMQLVFSLRVRDDRVKEVQTNFLIMYAIIPEMGGLRSLTLWIPNPPFWTNSLYSCIQVQGHYALHGRAVLHCLFFFPFEYAISYRNNLEKSHQSEGISYCKSEHGFFVDNGQYPFLHRLR